MLNLSEAFRPSPGRFGGYSAWSWLRHPFNTGMEYVKNNPSLPIGAAKTRLTKLEKEILDDERKVNRSIERFSRYNSRIGTYGVDEKNLPIYFGTGKNPFHSDPARKSYTPYYNAEGEHARKLIQIADERLARLDAKEATRQALERSIHNREMVKNAWIGGRVAAGEAVVGGALVTAGGYALSPSNPQPGNDGYQAVQLPNGKTAIVSANAVPKQQVAASNPPKNDSKPEETDDSGPDWGTWSAALGIPAALLVGLGAYNYIKNKRRDSIERRKEHSAELEDMRRNYY